MATGRAARLGKKLMLYAVPPSLVRFPEERVVQGRYAYRKTLRRPYQTSLAYKIRTAINIIRPSPRWRRVYFDFRARRYTTADGKLKPHDFGGSELIFTLLTPLRRQWRPAPPELTGPVDVASVPEKKGFHILSSKYAIAGNGSASLQTSNGIMLAYADGWRFCRSWRDSGVGGLGPYATMPAAVNGSVSRSLFRHEKEETHGGRHLLEVFKLIATATFTIPVFSPQFHHS
ncbi:hypothetical protein DFH11DRAFT_1548738 [Phellopilus nigrolimitatus]|nr:hypothetical protein DFH11DRAFT_1548738 [Phellopilus nigrolimitatus]